MYTVILIEIIILELIILVGLQRLYDEGYTLFDVYERVVYLKLPGYLQLIRFRRHGNEHRFLICCRTVACFNRLSSMEKACLEKAGWTGDLNNEFEKSWNGYRILRVMKDESLSALLDFGQTLRDNLGEDSIDNVANWLDSFNKEYRTHRLMNKVDEVMMCLSDEYPDVYDEILEVA